MEQNTNAASYVNDEVLSAAVDFIRVGGPDADGCTVAVSELFDMLQDTFGAQYRLSIEQIEVLNLISWLAVDPDVELLSDYGIDFGWRGIKKVV